MSHGAVSNGQRLAGRRIVVTGAASGMGAAIAETFAREGARLALLDIKPDEIGHVAAKTGQLGIVTDVASEASVNDAVAQAADALDGLDGVVNVAGILLEMPFEQTSFEAFQRVVGVNLAGPFLVMKAALPHLRAAPAATIVNISSMAALRPFPGMSVYSATKAGLYALGQALAPELGPTIRLNTICPGIIRTPMIEHLWAAGGLGDDGVAQVLQLRRPGTPTDIADAALYLTSAESAFVSMAVLAVNGGQLT